MHQYLIRSPEPLLEAMDALVDNYRFKSRTQLINVVMADWIARDRSPVDPYARALFGTVEADGAAAEQREEKKRKLLGPEWEKYKLQKVDLLDGLWENERSWEELERKSKALEERKQIKAEIAREVRDEMASELEELRAQIKRLSEQKGDSDAET